MAGREVGMAGRGAALGGSPFLPAQRSATDRCQGNGRLKDGGLRRTDDSPPRGALCEGPGCELWGQGASGGCGLEHSEVGHGGPGRNVGTEKISAPPWLGLGPAETSVSLGVLGCEVGHTHPPRPGLVWSHLQSPEPCSGSDTAVRAWGLAGVPVSHECIMSGQCPGG